ncbi:orofacial cleft 1 candidate gene 1 protein [Zalophus californianus]|uniref:Orofacial cleft 1 candidate gene 1 protein n=1 Tax=Zalophus californianus TaxID=9704 RepID=A0A6P9FFG9_ZALCA|nr:orofacial cleft 1 candidate gene 1 protein [Zalophus californianus]
MTIAVLPNPRFGNMNVNDEFGDDLNKIPQQLGRVVSAVEEASKEFAAVIQKLIEEGGYTLDPVFNVDEQNTLLVPSCAAFTTASQKAGVSLPPPSSPQSLVLVLNILSKTSGSNNSEGPLIGYEKECADSFKSVHCRGQGAENMDREKFQQKALKQTKQKKSKSAEFLMVKEDREAMEGIGNPAFNMSSPDLLAHQTSDKRVIRHDMPDHTLAAHQQKFGLLASAEPKGNEYSRNYFDPLMDEEINPRQCGMEVSREVDNRILCDRLMRLFDKHGQREAQDESFKEILDSEEPVSSRKRPEPRKEDSQATSVYNEASRRVQKSIILPGSSSLEQSTTTNNQACSKFKASSRGCQLAFWPDILSPLLRQN